MPAPTNTDITTATPITVPSTTVEDVSGISPAYTVWFSYLAQPGDVMVGLLAYAVSGSNYKPNLTVWIGPTGAPTMWPYDMTSFNTPQGNAFFDSDQPCQIPVTPGVTYYIKVEPNASSTAVAPNLTLVATAQPALLAAAGDLLITDDQHGFPAAVLSPTAGTTKRFYRMTNGEAGDVIRSLAVYALSNDDDVNEIGDPATIFLYNNSLTQIGSVSVSATAQSYSIRASASNFFYSEWTNPNGVVHKMSPAGVVSGTTWTITGAQIIAPSRDETILYYSNGNANQPIKRWDLVNNVGLSDLVAAPGASYSLLNTDGTTVVLSDGSIVVMWHTTPSGTFDIKQYSAAGALLQSYAFVLPAASQAGGRIAPCTDDPASFWAWSSYFSGSYVISKFTRFKTSDGSTITSFNRPVFEGGAGTAGTGNQGIPPVVAFGNSWSCPLVVLFGAVGPPTPPFTTTTYPVRRLRQSPHLSTMQLWQFFSMLQIDIEAGRGLSDNSDPQMMLSWSDDGGHTWSQEHWVSAGLIGQYARRAIWRILGKSRDRVWRVVVDAPIPWRILQAWAMVEDGTS